MNWLLSREDDLMGVKVRKRGTKWYVLVNYRGRRKSKCVGSREAAEQAATS